MTETIAVFVRTIPPGRVLGYAQVGDATGLRPRAVGRLLALGIDDGSDLPWHRVVGADGTLRIGHRSPDLAREQRQRLEAEGVLFTPSGRVASEYFWY